MMMFLMMFCVQGNGGTGTPVAEESPEEVVGGIYVQFDAPKAKVKKGWPSIRGTSV